MFQEFYLQILLTFLILSIYLFNLEAGGKREHLGVFDRLGVLPRIEPPICDSVLKPVPWL